MSQEPGTEPSEDVLLVRAVVGSLRRIVACLDDLEGDDLDWRPPALDTNSLPVIAVHALANAERNVLGSYCGQPYNWDRASEFGAARAGVVQLRQTLQRLQNAFEIAVRALGPVALEQKRAHPRLGEVTGRAVLLQAVRHAAEHVGEAELTRSLLLASRSPGDRS